MFQCDVGNVQIYIGFDVYVLFCFMVSLLQSMSRLAHDQLGFFMFLLELRTNRQSKPYQCSDLL